MVKLKRWFNNDKPSLNLEKTTKTKKKKLFKLG